MTRMLGIAAFAPETADIGVHRAVVRALDRGGADALLVADRPAAGEHPHLEPFTLLAALAPLSRRIGLVAGAGTGVHEPFTVARKLASLDHLCGGRGGWLTGTTTTQAEAANFGRAAEPPGRSDEFAEVAQALWDSFADGAVVRDVEAGRYYDPAGLHPPHHEGPHFRVRGPLNVSRPPQGHPVVVAPLGEFAVRFADIVLVEPATDAAAVEDRVAAAGRDPAEVRVWQILDAPLSADALEERFGSVADGFVLPVSGKADADRLAAELLPELRRRGLSNPEDVGPTLRDRLGLARPEAARTGGPV
jgi:alkanesulfonate monooxygenase SsuD/methylene tetrahydromethanopterin reductase-like flavin-dependent oxidoreductase (luciferase family)